MVNNPNKLPRAWAGMEKIAIDRLALFDLRGNSVTLRDYFDNLLVLIFLRHLA